MKRFISFFLAILIAVPMLVPVSAAGTNEVPVVGVLYDQGFYNSMNSYFSTFDLVGLEWPNTVCWAMMDKVVNSVGYGGFTSYSDLSKACSAVNQYFKNRGPLLSSIDSISAAVLDIAFNGIFKFTSWEIRENSQYGYVIVEANTGLTLCNSAGAFPYYKTTLPNDDDVDTSPLGGQWIREDRIPAATLYNVVNESTLYDIGQALKDTGKSYNQNKVVQYREKYQAIARTTEDYYYYYCDSSGRPYVYRVDPDQWAQDKDNNYYTDDDDDDVYDQGPTENNQLIDLDNNTVWFPDGTFNYISQLLYDESTKTYYVDAHTEVDVTNNTYITNNYYYEYHINYTSVTYIGASEEYNKLYEFYYELPDGRNSADLTAEELLALNTNIDVVPYIRSADNAALRSLYHFDGNTFDSSYWNYTTEFTWNKGASITYLESNAFNGALYLDETEHQFTITAPSCIGSQDFTLQWRMYNSATAAPVSDSYVSMAGSQLFTFSGSYITFGGTQYAVPVGNWYEVALIRYSGVLRLYLNGLCVASVANTTVFAKDIVFYFGNQQQTYKQIDELRLLNYPLVKSGASYTPTAVPYDTNLALVLPDSTVPVADEYWQFNTSGNLFTDYDFTDSAISSSFGVYNWSRYLYASEIYSYSFNKWYYPGTNALTVSFLDGYTSLNNSLSTSYPPLTLGYVPSDTFCRAIVADYYENANNQVFRSKFTGLTRNDTCTFSVMLSDGSLYSATFSLNVSNWSGDYVSTRLPNGGSIGAFRGTDGNSYNRYICLFMSPPAGGPLDIIYTELVKGSTPNSGHELVSGISPVNSDFKTPTLAVRTSQEITSYQIGGVRPSLPTKGLVWALVEDSRITSLQIYNGQAWEAVDGRIWTGSRWVPYYAYDVVLLKDMYDIIEADPSQEYIYTEQGFWAWCQSFGSKLLSKLDQILAALGGSKGVADHEHVYTSTVDREPTCTDPGLRTYTCTVCDHTYTELIDPLEHDWVVTGHVDPVLDEEGNVLEEGYDELTCSRCEAESKDYGDGPKEEDIFDALGDLIADGITWILDKLTELTDSLRGITDIFNSFTQKIQVMAGEYPLFFAAFMALIPEDLSTVPWFGVIAFVVIAVWKKWSK